MSFPVMATHQTAPAEIHGQLLGISTPNNAYQGPKSSNAWREFESTARLNPNAENRKQTGVAAMA